MRRLSKSQCQLLWMGEGYVHHGEIRTARSLMRLGLGHLEDNGLQNNRSRDERWYFALTDAGRIAKATPSCTTTKSTAKLNRIKRRGKS